MTLPTAIKWTFCARTDVGLVRKGNEDNFLILDLSTNRHWTAHETAQTGVQTFEQGRQGAVFAVSDGMGGALAGEVASRMAVELVRAQMVKLQGDGEVENDLFAQRLRAAIEEANAAIYSQSLMNAECRGMGATFTAVALDGETAYFAQIGDSRAHVIRDGQLKRITKDQSYVQQLVDLGQITEEEAETHGYRNYILQALGPMPSVSVEMSKLRLQSGDLLLLCSDGLSGKLREPEMLEIVMKSGDLGAACEELVRAANERGGEDNITVVLAQFTSRADTVPEGEIPEPELVARAPDDDGAASEPLSTDHQAMPPAAPDRITLDDTAGVSPVAVPTTAQLGLMTDPPTTETVSAVFSRSEGGKSNDPSAQSDVNTAAAQDTSPRAAQQSGERRISGRKFAVAFVGVMIILSALAVFLHTQLSASRAAVQQRIYAEELGRIAALQSRIAELRRRTTGSPQAADYNAQLNFLAHRLNEATTLPPTKFREIGEARVAVERAILELERALPTPPEKGHSSHRTTSLQNA